jgi:hypothetical protein
MQQHPSIAWLDVACSSVTSCRQYHARMMPPHLHIVRLPTATVFDLVTVDVHSRQAEVGILECDMQCMVVVPLCSRTVVGVDIVLCLSCKRKQRPQTPRGVVNHRCSYCALCVLTTDNAQSQRPCWQNSCGHSLPGNRWSSCHNDTCSAAYWANLSLHNNASCRLTHLCSPFSTQLE